MRNDILHGVHTIRLQGWLGKLAAQAANDKRGGGPLLSRLHIRANPRETLLPYCKKQEQRSNSHTVQVSPRESHES